MHCPGRIFVYGITASDRVKDNYATVCRKTYIIIENGVWGVAPSGVRAAAPHSAPFLGKGVWGFGMDAEIERPKALQDAKPTKRSYRDRG